MEIKRKIYVFGFTVLGLLIGFLIHAMTEIVYVRLLVRDFTTYSFGLTWKELIQFHYLLSGVIFVVCGLWGWAAGRYWWKQIYVLKRYDHKRWMKFFKLSR